MSDASASRETPSNAVLEAMLDRLYASLMRGPGLNCRPGRSRQRIDLADLDACNADPAVKLFQQLLSPKGQAFIGFNVPRPDDYQAFARFGKKKQTKEEEQEEKEESPELKAYRRQQKLVKKFRNIIDDARTYQQDTGVHALSLGYPILSVPPGVMGTGRILAPVAFVPVSLALKAGGRPGVQLECDAADADRVVVNPALMAWLERNTGVRVPDDLFDDEAGDEPWREIKELIAFIANAMRLDDIDPDSFLPLDQRPKPAPDEQTSGGEEHPDQATGNSGTPQATETPENPAEWPPPPPPFTLASCPNADGLPDQPAVLRSAVLGLFPAGNQGLIRDTRAMLATPHELVGPVLPFAARTAVIEPPPQEHETPNEDTDNTEEDPPFVGREAEVIEDHDKPRPVALADPCQLRAVTLARTHRALVLHGPPGTGKSQTITNIIGDHLARGQRVLFVCDKRTALDVVAHRLDSLGLSPLCAVVHDPQRDQRDLYMGVRAQLDQLTDDKTHPRAEKRLTQIDQEIDEIHTELSTLHDALMQRVDDRPGIAAESFHELVGRWLAIDAPSLPGAHLTNITLEDLEKHRRNVELALERGNDIVYPTHPWAAAARGPLETYLAQPVDELRRKLASCVEDARAADATANPDIPPFNPAEPLPQQATRRAALLEHLQWIDAHPDEDRLRHAAALDADSLPRMLDKLGDSKPWRDSVNTGALDAELWLSTQADVPTPRVLAEQFGALEQYLDTATKWYGFLSFGAKSRAAKALRTYGLKRTPEDAARLRDFLAGVRARVLLSAAAETLTGCEPTADVWPDEKLTHTLAQFDHLLPALQLAEQDDALRTLFHSALKDSDTRQRLIAGLTASPARSDALHTLETSLKQTGLFNDAWQHHATAAFRAYQPQPETSPATSGPEAETPEPSEKQGKPATPTLTRLHDRFDDLETVLRIHDSLDGLPSELREATANLLEAAAEPAQGVAALTKRIIEHTLTARVAAHPSLARLDPAAVDHAFARHAELEKERREKTTDAVLHRWRSLQRERLLVGTGSKLNALGAAVRQRLYVRGKRAMRLRQVIEVGQNASYDDDRGDPIFDLAPVWLASPETVAQCFPRKALFDVVIFDEASQCRLEEALPVLTRAKRVVIAGDPKQLPPTRFFEAALQTSDDVEIRDEDDLFEAQQTEVEDLLAAALNLDVQESYLDVHYRSRNADLIEFSNDYFYQGRLQAIPGHPRNISRFAPLSLHRADGVYEERVNPEEANRVVQLIDDLLKRADPPSIGIACFNLSQRDLIAEALDDKALEDDAFAKRLEMARNRDGESSFEGLFVKNLENVQGDERDHIIISTTYGPNPEGKFYRRFGPLAMAGGGRRLNVLVTRARQEVHLVTSIPPSAYRGAEPVPEGASPSGSWLLFAYLRYAEALEEEYEQQQRVLETQEQSPAAAMVMPTEHPSRFAKALADALAQQRSVASDVFWGNEGFCVDLALHHPAQREAATLGTLTDFSRFKGPSDAVSWDLYRVGILRWQGWELHRLWTPTFFRDPQRCVNQLLQDAEAHAK